MSSQLDKIFDEDYPWDRDSETYKQLENRVEFKGLLVTESGYVFRKRDGRQVKPKYVFTTLANGARKVKSINIEFANDGIRYYKSYQRFVYAAWHDDFDMDDSSLIVVSTTDNRFEFRPTHMEVITRAEHLENLRQLNMKYDDGERELLAKKYYEMQDDVTQKKFARFFDISVPTLAAILKEYPNEK